MKIRQFALILLKRFSLESTQGDDATSIICSIGGEAIESVKSNILMAMGLSLPSATRHKVCFTISDIAAHLSSKGSEWNELQMLIYNFAHSKNSEQR